MNAARGTTDVGSERSREFPDSWPNDRQQIVGQYRRSHQHLETFAAFGPASLHPPAAKQHRDATLDADAKALALLERPAALQRFPLRRLLPATLRNAHSTDAGLPAVL